MTNSFANMNEEYVRKHFPNGSVFDGAVKTVKRTTIIAIFCFSVFLAGALAGLFWAVGRTMELMAEGRDDLRIPGTGCSGMRGYPFLHDPGTPERPWGLYQNFRKEQQIACK